MLILLWSIINSQEKILEIINLLISNAQSHISSSFIISVCFHCAIQHPHSRTLVFHVRQLSHFWECSLMVVLYQFCHFSFIIFMNFFSFQFLFFSEPRQMPYLDCWMTSLLLDDGFISFFSHF